MNIETANRLMELRKQHNYSQEDLAAQLGISRQAVSKWERAEASPDTENLISLARLYHISLDELLGNSLPEPFAPPPEGEPPQNPLARTGFPLWFVVAVACVALTALAILGVALFRAQSFFPIVLIVGFLACAFSVKKWRHALTASYPVFCVLIYLLCGFLFGSWHPTWLIFLTIPIFYTLPKANAD